MSDLLRAHCQRPLSAGLHSKGCAAFSRISPNISKEESGIKQDIETGEEDQCYTKVCLCVGEGMCGVCGVRVHMHIQYVRMSVDVVCVHVWGIYVVCTSCFCVFCLPMMLIIQCYVHIYHIRTCTVM